MRVAGRDALRQLLAANRGVVLQFSATWCGPCQRFKPIVEAGAKRYPELKFLLADVDEAPELVEEHSVSSVPATFFFLNGSHHDQLQGSSPDRFNAVLAAMRAKLSPTTPH